MIDIQSTSIDSAYDLKSVGVVGVRYPLALHWNTQHNVVASWQLGVSVPRTQRGTHMSRFVELLEGLRTDNKPLDATGFVTLAKQVNERLESDAAEVTARFSVERRMVAPVSKLKSSVLYDCEWSARTQRGANESQTFSLKVTVPCKALCPCSKAISERGAHNQRSLVEVTYHFKGANVAIPSVDAIAERVESAASAPVWSLLKRDDEKYVTEHAYDHPVFVEDLARACAAKLVDFPGISGLDLQVTNQESIHPHDCYARLTIN